MINICRVVFIFGPFHRVIYNIFPDAIHFFFIAYDVFVIIALSDGVSQCFTYLVDLF